MHKTYTYICLSIEDNIVMAKILKQLAKYDKQNHGQMDNIYNAYKYNGFFIIPKCSKKYIYVFIYFYIHIFLCVHKFEFEL